MKFDKLYESVTNEGEVGDFGDFKVGDVVKFKGPRQRRQYKVIDLPKWGGISLEALSGGVRGSRPTGVNPTDIELVGSKPTELRDKDGLTAPELANKLYKNKSVIVDWYNTTSEMMGKVLKITPKGQMKVQLYHHGRSGSQETTTPTDFTKGKTITFSPKFYNNEWAWWKDGQVIKKVYDKGDPLTNLLD